MEAFYTNREINPLFAIYYPGSREEGFVLCAPSPQDTTRAQHAQILLAKKLQALGYPVLRFDYSGTGDSTGETTTLNQWKMDLLHAASVFRKKSGVSKISLIGTRLGGMLALLASQDQGFKRIFLWDPVIDGKKILNDFLRTHKLILNRVPDEAPYAANQILLEQSCGYAWPNQLQDELAAIGPKELHSFCKDIRILSFEPDRELEALADLWRSEGKSVQLKASPDDMKWCNDLFINLQAFPSATLGLLLQTVEEA